MPFANPEFNRILVRAVYEGVRPSPDQGSIISYKEVLNYYEFRANIQIKSDFFQVILQIRTKI